jgi:hypothetical protein
MNSLMLHLIPDELELNSSGKPSHTVAQCLWDTTFDDQSLAYQLQEYLSQWSNTELSSLLDRAFQQFCPVGQIWRIGTLNLDLGEIDLDELRTELPRRVQAGLFEQLRRLLYDSSWQARSDETFFPQNELRADSQIISPIHSLNDFVGFFLRNGDAPWWYSGNQSNQAILLMQLENSPRQVAAIIRDAGQAEAVRKRIVWQYNSEIIKKIIRVLEPKHHDYIETYADNLIDLQIKTRQPGCDTGAFERQSWFWILTHLLVERGSLFNTIAFVESTLRQMAHGYQLDFRSLLLQLVTAAQSLEFKGSSRPRFIQALIYVQQKTLTENPQNTAVKPDTDYWQAFTHGLHGRQQSARADDVYHLGELFTLLTLENPLEMTALLRREGREAKVRQRLISQFKQDELCQVLKLLAPQDYQFILSYAHQNCEVLIRHKTGEQLVWEVLLAYLLTNSGSRFNPRRFIDTTLLRISQARGISYMVLLDMLTQSPMFYQADAQCIELLSIFNDLKLETHRYEDNRLQTDSLYAEALALYLTTGQAAKVLGKHYLPLPELMFSVLLYGQPAKLALLITAAFNKGSDKGQSLKISGGTDVNAGTRIQRLMGLIPSADFPLVLRTLNEPAAQFANDLIATLIHWQSRQRLPSLNGFDLYYQLHGLILRILIDRHGSGFSLAQFLPDFFNRLSESHHVNTDALKAEILLSFSQTDSQSTPYASNLQMLLQWLTHFKTGQPDPGVLASQRNETELPGQKMNALLCCLRADKTGLQKLGLTSDPETVLPCLLDEIVPAHTGLLLDQLQQQTDRQALAQAIFSQAGRPLIQQWLSTLWPSGNKSAWEFMEQWQNVIAQSGLWQGSLGRLQQILHSVFYLSVLDLALAKHGGLGRNHLNDLLDTMVQLSCRQLHINLVQLSQNSSLNQARLWRPAVERLAGTLIEGGPAKAADKHIQKSKMPPQDSVVLTKPLFVQDLQGQYLNHPLLFILCQCLLLHGRPPLWLETQTLNLHQMIADLLQLKPQLLQRIIKSIQHQPEVMFRLQHLINYTDLLAAAAKTDPHLEPLLAMLTAVYQAFLHLRFDAMDSGLPAALLWQKTLQAWLNGNWQALQPLLVFIGLSAELIRRQNISTELIEAEFKRKKLLFPAECQTVITNGLRAAQTQAEQTLANNIYNPVVVPPSKNKQASEPTMPIQINNAGLVLFQGFITTYFKRLELVNGNAFCSAQTQRNAVHCLQYLATGLAATEEQHLVLNKVLCGLAPPAPIELGIELTLEQEATADSLIEAIINYWPAIGSSSIDGFRGNWLVRNGLLSQSDDSWALVIEKRPYDLLLQSAPFSYNLIKLPWMTKALYVTWHT